MDLDTWYAGGERIPIEFGSSRHEIYRRIDGMTEPGTPSRSCTGLDVLVGLVRSGRGAAVARLHARVRLPGLRRIRRSRSPSRILRNGRYFALSRSSSVTIKSEEPLDPLAVRPSSLL
jgi:hypothetical protein